MMRTADGWWGLSLPRTSDLELVPALVAESVLGEPWSVVACWSASVTTAEAVERGRLLDLACCDPANPISSRPGVISQRGGRRTALRTRPRIIDLTALWAGPLCAHLLGLGDADVVKVESVHRPDGARRGTPAFFDLLNSGRTMVTLDLAEATGVERLRELVATADLVLESSRARALRRFGIHAEEVVADGTCWLSITARGRDNDSVGFGDDVAAGAGLWVEDRGGPIPCGDALADPLTGVTAAAEAAEALLAEEAVLIDVSMHDVAVAAARGGQPEHEVHRDRAGNWWVTGAAASYSVLEPEARR